MMILAFFVLFALLPWSWTKRVWGWLKNKLWANSALKVGVEIGGQKVKSMRDDYLSKKNAKKEGDDIK